jgi:type I restriction enzyme S subunit
MSFPRYPEYKDSGVESLGKVPGHWGVKRLKRNMRLLTEKTDRRDYPVALENIEGWTGRFIATETEFQGDGIAFEPDDILFGKLRPYLAKAYRAEFSGEAVGDFHVMRPFKGIDSRFAQYQILNREFIAIVDGSTFGSKMPRASWEFVGDMMVTTPPLPEQTQIAAFLDRETAKIDALVAEQRRLMALLKEKRQAVISHAVTRGLNTDAPMKPSGIEWLGNVPEHWEVQPIKRIVSVPITDGPHETPNFIDEGVPFVSAEAVSSGSINFSKVRACISEEDNVRYSLKYAPKLHDIYMVKSGATTGITAIVEDRTDFNIWSPLAAIRCNEGSVPHFVLNFMRSKHFQEAVTLNWSFGTQQNIGMGVIENLSCTVPPVDEQHEIAQVLKTESTKFDILTTEAQRAIDLLQERRTALISAAVTGQIDVRGVFQ